MKTIYTDQNIQFKIEHTTFSALNIVYETFHRTIPQHSHGNNSYEIHYIPYGKGQVVIDNTTYDVSPNTLYVTGPHVNHAQIPDNKDPMIEYCILLKLDTKSLAKSEGSILSLFADTPIWFGQDTQELHLHMQNLFHELKYQYAGYMTQVETLLSQMIIKLVRNYKHRSESVKHFPQSNLGDSKSLVVEEYFLYEYKTLTLEKLAARLSLSPRQTERFIKDYYGKTFLQKKMESKMAVAALRLLDSDMSITELAFDLGYSTVEHFSYAFKSYYGMTASTYRKRNQTP